MIKTIILNWIGIALTTCLLSTNCGEIEQSQCLQCLNDACISCINYWDIEDNICVPIPTKQSDGSIITGSIEHCKWQVNTIDLSICKECQLGYKLLPNRKYCQFDYIPISQCSEYTSDNLQCTKCDNGYVPTKNQKQCVIQISNCKEQDLNGCISCLENYTKKNDQECIEKQNNNSYQIMNLSIALISSLFIIFIL